MDLGSGPGSLNWETMTCKVIRLDLQLAAKGGSAGIIADATELPILDKTIAAVVAGHSLEHISPLDAVIKEIARVLKHSAFIYVSVPDASTVSDRLYRWLGRGGGHVNAFLSESDIRCRIESQTGLTCVGSRLLFSSFAFLGPRIRGGRRQRKLLLFGGASHPIVASLAGCLRLIDTLFGSRFSVYGWEYIFCASSEGKSVVVELNDWLRCWTNVCSSCGASHSVERLARDRHLRLIVGSVGVFRCPACGSVNLATSEIENRCLRLRST